MRLRLQWFVAAATILATAAYAQPATAQDAPSNLDAARKALFVEAIQALAKKDWATCRIKALGVWTEENHPQVGALLGVCEAQLSMWAEAAEHLDYHRKLDDGKNPSRTKDVEEAWVRVRPHVAIIEVQSATPKAMILVNDGAAAPSPKTLYVVPGNVTVEVRAEGYKSARRQMVAQAGQSAQLVLNLERDGAQPSTGRALWPIGIFATVGAVGLGMGIAGFVISGQKGGDAGDVANQIGDQTCWQKPDLCDEGQAALDDEAAFKVVGGTGVALAGAALIATIVYFAIPTGNDRRSALYLTPAAGQGFGLSLGGTF